MMIALFVSLAVLLPLTQEAVQEAIAWHAELRPRALSAPQGKRGKTKPKRRSVKRTPALALEDAIDWLVSQQEDDGRWPSLAKKKAILTSQPLDVGVTGLALLALFSEGHNLTSGKHKASVKKGVDWLLVQQDPKTGCLGPAESTVGSYNHALATWALVELYGHSKPKELESKVQKALDHTKWRRNPDGVWRYFPRDGDNDSSITGWMMLGLLAGERYKLVKIEKDKEAALVWYSEVTDPKSGRVDYTSAVKGSVRPKEYRKLFPAKKTEAMTALALLVRLRCGETTKKEPALRQGLKRILKLPPKWAPTKGNIDLYYWFCGSLALAEAKTRKAKKWYDKLNKALLGSQVLEGEAKGSWDPSDPWSNIGGRTYMTTMAILSLSVATGKSRLLSR